ncbi:penicillin-binding protein 2 [Virgibacillus sp. MSP4-1]|uniref:peptidoglycan D,D-transpeptidase FtsI family protein n=1 Tax=Virgibacillus sp. MSP4-1 TaxID=2700081 RepID=UPI0003A3ED38|nr:penicillin-binding protein 2 [Virgibacillus sp. MSP4-1]QHS22770.1 penicillin-binding protein 2 [Virgibacillus sp. MSP4-1]
MTPKKSKSHLPLRLNILFFLIFLLFAFLIIQLGVVQILHGDAAQREVSRTEDTTVSNPVPRGEIYDRYGRLLVENEPRYAITYTPPKNVQPKDRLELAEKLSKYMEKKPDKVTKRDKQDYWIMKNRKEAYNRLSSKEEGLSDEEQYYEVLDKVTEQDLQQLNEEDLEIIAIKRELDQAPALTPHVVKNSNISEKEYATVAEHLSELPGINVTTDWKRNKIFHPTFSNFIGGMTSLEEGLPKEKLDYYLSRQYGRNERVGESFLEEEYESTLAGQKELVEYVTDKEGNIIDSKLIREGKQGKSLKLTIDIELQKRVDKIVREEMKKIIDKYPGKNQHFKDALVVMSDPNTGEILAMSGQHYDHKKNEFSDQSYRTVYDAHRPGSAIKGATVLAGFESGVIRPGTTFYDSPIKIASTPEKSSYRTLGYVNDLDALAKSSNVYMFYIALRMGGDYTNYRYVKNESSKVKNSSKTLQDLRYYFNQFGLGVSTGIDLPYEATGYKGDNPGPGLLMDYAIGQFDTYTALQLNQYVSTIANGGYRLQPQLVQGIYNSTANGELNQLYKGIQPKVLNRIDMNDKYLDRVQEGFRRVFQHPDGTADHVFASKPYNPAGKTGTAENEIYAENEKGEVEKVADVENHNLVGYAPYDDPEVAFSIIVPNVGLDASDGINSKIGSRILDAYFELKKQRAENGINMELNQMKNENSSENEQNG